MLNDATPWPKLMPLILDTESTNRSLSELRGEVRKGHTLQEASQRLMDGFRKGFGESVVLARTYATVPYGLLPEKDQSFVRSSAEAKGMASSLTEGTRVLSLLGTAGVHTEWCDRYRSRGHLGIPLFSQDVVEEIPMVAALIRQLGGWANWYHRFAPSQQTTENFAAFTESFFVGAPGKARDAAGRLLIPAQDFVQENGIKSVFGVGGEFAASRIILVCIFFSSESLKQTPPWLLRVPLMLATVTGPIVSEGRIFR